MDYREIFSKRRNYNSFFKMTSYINKGETRQDDNTASNYQKEERWTLGSTVIKPFAIGINRMANVKIVLRTLPKYSPSTLVLHLSKK